MVYHAKKNVPKSAWKNTIRKNDFETKVANETTHNLDVADQKIFLDSIFDPFL